MRLKVYCCCTYRTTGRNWSPKDWAACFFIKALKNKPLKGYAHITLPGNRIEKIDNATADQAPQWFAAIAADRIRWSTIGPTALVPIPDSSCSTASTTAPRTVSMARCLASLLTSQCVMSDVLRWIQAMPASHQSGGTRDPHMLLDFLRCTAPIDSARKVVLIDDVLSSGAHLRAATALVTKLGTQVAGAICAGRADNEFAGRDAFAGRVETLPDLEPITFDDVAPL